MNSVVKANINNKNIKIIYFSFLYDNIDYELEKYSEINPNSNFTIIDHIRSFRELLLSEYFKNKGEKLKNYENDQKQIERLILRKIMLILIK